MDEVANGSTMTARGRAPRGSTLPRGRFVAPVGTDRARCAMCRIVYERRDGDLSCPLCNSYETVRVLETEIATLKTQLEEVELRKRRAERRVDVVEQMRAAAQLADDHDRVLLKEAAYLARLDEAVTVTPSGSVIEVRHNGQVERHEMRSAGGRMFLVAYAQARRLRKSRGPEDFIAALSPLLAGSP